MEERYFLHFETGIFPVSIQPTLHKISLKNSFMYRAYFFLPSEGHTTYNILYLKSPWLLVKAFSLLQFFQQVGESSSVTSNWPKNHFLVKGFHLFLFPIWQNHLDPKIQSVLWALFSHRWFLYARFLNYFHDEFYFF